MEQKTRFDDITWPTLKTGIMSEGGDVHDKPLPEFYRCDGIHTSLPYENSYKMGSLVQIQSKEAQARHAATFATSKALDHVTWPLLKSRIAPHVGSKPRKAGDDKLCACKCLLVLRPQALPDSSRLRTVLP